MFTVADLRKALKGVPDDLEVRLTSDTGVDQGEGDIKIESAGRITYTKSKGFKVDYFEIYANDITEEDEEE